MAIESDVIKAYNQYLADSQIEPESYRYSEKGRFALADVLQDPKFLGYLAAFYMTGYSPDVVRGKLYDQDKPAGMSAKEWSMTIHFHASQYAEGWKLGQSRL